jgi:hypothetical protein
MENVELVLYGVNPGTISEKGGRGELGGRSRKSKIVTLFKPLSASSLADDFWSYWKCCIVYKVVWIMDSSSIEISKICPSKLLFSHKNYFPSICEIERSVLKLSAYTHTNQQN